MSINVDAEDSITSVVSGSSFKDHSKIYVGELRVYLIRPCSAGLLPVYSIVKD